MYLLQRVSYNGSGNGLARNRMQAITRPSDDTVHRRHMASLGHNGLTHCGLVKLILDTDTGLPSNAPVWTNTSQISIKSKHSFVHDGLKMAWNGWHFVRYQCVNFRSRSIALSCTWDHGHGPSDVLWILCDHIGRVWLEFAVSRKFRLLGSLYCANGVVLHGDGTDQDTLLVYLNGFSVIFGK